MAAVPSSGDSLNVPTRAVVKLCQAVYHGNAGHFVPRAVEALRVDGFVADAASIVPVGAPNPALGGAVEGFVVPCRPAGWPADEGHTALLVIRGSRSDVEWARNYERALVPLPRGAGAPPGARCHEGFRRSWEDFSLQAAAAVAATRARTVVFAGNSRGSALVTIGLLHCHGLWRGRSRNGAGDDGDGDATAPERAHAASGGAAVSGEAAGDGGRRGPAASPPERAEAVPDVDAASAGGTAGPSDAAAGTGAAARPAKWLPGRVQLVTFASPRCGNHAMVRAVEEVVGAAGRIERWCVGTDLVPCVPPAILGYRHTRGCRYVRSLAPETRPASQSAVTLVGAALWAAACWIRPQCGRAPWQDHDIDSLTAWIAAQSEAESPLAPPGLQPDSDEAAPSKRASGPKTV